MRLDEWSCKKLSEITIKIGSGATPKGGKKVYQQYGVPFIRSQNIYNNLFNAGGLAFIDKEKARKLMNVEIKKDDVLLNITGDSVARCTKVPLKYVGGRVNQHVAIIRPDQKYLLPDFLKYYLVTPFMQESMLSLARMGGTRAALTKGMIESFKIPVPKIREQEFISTVLSTIDDKIGINTRINQNLEAMAQAIFKHWFVDFEFPNEEGRSYKSSGGEMVESELGLIPRRWEVSDLGSISEIQNGFAFKASDYVADGVKVLRTLNIGENGYFTNNNLVYLPQKYRSEKYEKYILKNFDVALVMVGASIGKIGMVLRNTEGSLQNQNMWRFRSKDGQIPQLFLYYLVKEAQKVASNWETGSARLFYRKDSFSKIKVIFPNNNTLMLFKKVSSAIFNRVNNNVIENERLVILRDTLLPKLMSGEIRVPMEEI
ncbi:restriction endonuclease subunit S [Sporolactobacillus terrae]|uniref:restriction endonuclease subunit S n=2 Tax=Sporolactobacillus terrae TaxID=269673 RepID=UPI001CBE2776|nr:restriction endonuclease subunit S [Sporolactobacillus terrae]UAK15358.1 restriction endonuclease subunit S [Sporolactobacillus terrae]